MLDNTNIYKLREMLGTLFFQHSNIHSPIW